MLSNARDLGGQAIQYTANIEEGVRHHDYLKENNTTATNSTLGLWPPSPWCLKVITSMKHEFLPVEQAPSLIKRTAGNSMNCCTTIAPAGKFACHVGTVILSGPSISPPHFHLACSLFSPPLSMHPHKHWSSDFCNSLRRKKKKWEVHFNLHHRQKQTFKQNSSTEIKKHPTDGTPQN